MQKENKEVKVNKNKFFLTQIISNIKNSIWMVVVFACLLSLYLVASIASFLCNAIVFSKGMRMAAQEKIWKIFEKVGSIFEKKEEDSIKRAQLIDLSIRNMKARKARTIITIGGMMVGIGAIVFLVSIGYGLQDLVISRVAKLDEMKQTTVMIQSGSRFPLNDETLAKFRELTDVEMALPVISVVGKVNLNGSISDMAAYGVTSEYLKRTDIRTTYGGIFSNDELIKTIPTKQLQTSEVGENSNQDIEVVSESDEAGIVKNDPAGLGEFRYNEKGELVMAKNEQQFNDVMKILLDDSAERNAVVNQSMLATLGIKDNEAVGQKFSTSLVVVGNLLGDSKEKIQSAPEEYEIVGVVPEGKTPMFYIPFINLRSLGVVNYSQVKISVTSPESLAKVRRQVESMGYRTHSVADTVDQINSLFSTIRFFLALVGMIALSVAALGMFNTLTVSLLERTREVGLMKSMGMKSEEVQELFLTESMTMGFLGGVLGIFLGYLGGKLLGIMLSIYAVSKGAGFVDISFIPWSLVAIIIFLSLFVGIVTGIYPARRAKMISALDALRYE